MAIRIISILSLALIFSIFSIVHCRTGLGDGEQEWGYATVRPGAHMFWWLYYTTNKEVESFYEKPLIIWLSGGPGVSSTAYGNFAEIGPLDMKLQPRNSTWVKNYNVLFIDNPVGVGFSYVDSEDAYAIRNAQIGVDLLQTMRNFYGKFPKFRQVPVYIVAESYGGKYAVELALRWYRAEKLGSIKSNLKGVALGDASISSIDNYLTWGSFLLQLGIVDTDGSEKIQAAALELKKATDAGLWDKAIDISDDTDTLVMDLTNSVDFYNVLSKIRSTNSKKQTVTARAKRSLEEDINELDVLMNVNVKNALNLTRTAETSSDKVFDLLRNDILRPVVHMVESLLDETDLKVVVYNGQLDFIINTSGVLKWAENMKWSHVNDWRASERSPLVVNGIIEGYVKTYKNFAFYWVSRSGHMVPSDNPIAMDAILKAMTKY